ncbi:RagB/SusD family nutrient uptake outer membrane protein [Parapedobacter sp. 10938]|uniref:RagB/SusD family nutrient uptake outer membrane protein n=1 Tax=Parapedobacter flavus TaxID=3110225 RepID=UPI002DBF21CC|nr:RagB/SusD family nutrient uptake outer membrane protein [Parapedobacter sp. 10938]MEC3881949.1 RagB/SusD family nutrient uptake outer membrane protein [Parapedobacter sp. 10938]
MKRKIIYWSWMAIVALFCSCQEFLSEKPSSSLAVPNTLKDLQAIIDYQARMNAYYPPSGDIGADYYYLRDADWQARPEYARDTYTWQPTVEIEQDWSTAYNRIFHTNVVLEAIDDVSLGGMTEADRRHIKGSALFLRGWTYLQLAQLFVPPYLPGDEDSPYGIPIRLIADINAKTVRATVGETYQQIASDLKEAANLLPDRALLATRPSKPAAFGALSRAYLSMGNYEEALHYANLVMTLKNDLIDYNTLNTSDNNPFRELNDEVLFHATLLGVSAALIPSIARVDTNLYRSYTDTDLRKELFYFERSDGSIQFKASYDGSSAGTFSGLATDEVYLTKAESLIRLGRIAEGMETLDELLQTRWAGGTYQTRQWEGEDDALARVLEERRKQLAFRGGIRWMDLRRLNTDPRFQTTLNRVVEGNVFTLPPQDKRYTFLIPSSVIQQSGIEQNPR